MRIRISDTGTAYRFLLPDIVDNYRRLEAKTRRQRLALIDWEEPYLDLQLRRWGTNVPPTYECMYE